MKHLLFLAIPVSFFAGFLAARGGPKAGVSEPKSERRDGPVAEVPIGSEAVVERQRDEIRRLHAEVERLKAPTPPAAAKLPDKSKVAAEILDLFLRAKRKETAPEDKMEIIRRLGDLEPSMAAIFIERYRTATDPEHREVAFMLTVLSGGPDASRFAAELLKDATVDAPTRRQLMRSLAGLDDMPVRCTAEESLTKLGVEWTRSSQGDERAAAAGILGMGGSPEGTVLLRSLAEADASEQVRAAAVMGLGKCGDADTLAYLKAMESRPDLTDYVRRYVKAAIGSLERRLSK